MDKDKGMEREREKKELGFIHRLINSLPGIMLQSLL